MNFDFGRVSESENVPPDSNYSLDTTNPEVILSIIQGPPQGNFDSQASFYLSQLSWFDVANRKGQKS